MEEQEEVKIGAGHAQAMLRAGAKELAQALPAFPSASIQPVEEQGAFGNLTPQEVVAEKGSYEEVLAGYAQRGQQQEPEKEMER